MLLSYSYTRGLTEVVRRAFNLNGHEVEIRLKLRNVLVSSMLSIFDHFSKRERHGYLVNVENVKISNKLWRLTKLPKSAIEGTSNP